MNLLHISLFSYYFLLSENNLYPSEGSAYVRFPDHLTFFASTHYHTVLMHDITQERSMATSFNSIFQQLLARPLPPLTPTKIFSTEIKQAIKSLNKSESNVVAILDLLNDDIHACHINVQDREMDPAADYMHAILHRREQDWWNSSSYWLSRANHPAIKATFGNGAEQTACQELQWNEMVALARHFL